MAHYRLYVLDKEDHIRHAFDLECEGDTEAVARATDRLDGSPLELWKGPCRVARLEAPERTSATSR